MTFKRLRGAALGFAVLLFAAGCWSGTSGDGPLGKVGPDGRIGITGPIGAVGTDIFTNKSSKPVVVQSASLVSPVRLKLVTTLILPLHGNFSFGTSAWPVPESFVKKFLFGVDWAARQVVGSAVIQPKEQAEVIAVVQLTNKRHQGTAKGVTVYYSVSGHHYFRTGPNAVIMTVGS